MRGSQGCPEQYLAVLAGHKGQDPDSLDDDLLSLRSSKTPISTTVSRIWLWAELYLGTDGY
jgi:hypothetical protein